MEIPCHYITFYFFVLATPLVPYFPALVVQHSVTRASAAPQSVGVGSLQGGKRVTAASTHSVRPPEKERGG